MLEAIMTTIITDSITSLIMDNTIESLNCEKSSIDNTLVVNSTVEDIKNEISLNGQLTMKLPLIINAIKIAKQTNQNCTIQENTIQKLTNIDPMVYINQENITSRECMISIALYDLLQKASE